MTSTPRHNIDKRVIRTKKAIKNALFKIMETKDISDITISELTAGANVNRRTFYTHYRCITDILNEIESDLVAVLSELLAKFDITKYRKSIYTLFIDLHRMITGEFDYYFHLMRMDMRGVLISRLKNALKSSSEVLFKSFPESTSEHATLISAFLAGGFLAFYTEWYYSENRIPLEKAADIVSTLADSCIRISKELK
ncbi:MAG: TetR/AcrR family transcriptional regulator [Oscillospiraceae bacterium]|nr:TetR/AcrR family transcriptional regulator [Oscillospiraceae bacterium]